MSSLRLISGTQPGALDPTQRQRVLQSENATLAFADYNGGPMPPQVLEPLHQLFSVLHARRIAVETSPNGRMHWRFVPSAVLNGVQDEGIWPQTVNFMGQETVTMTRDQWDIHKLDPKYVCQVDRNLPSIWPAGSPRMGPISPPATDSDVKHSRSGAGTSSQPYVVDDPDRSSAPLPAPRASTPVRDRQEKRNPYAARVSSISESEDEEDELLASSPEPAPEPQPGDVQTPARHAEQQQAAEATPKSAKRKASSSPPKNRARSPSVISISSDSGAETATPRRPKRPPPRAHTPVYRRALFDPARPSASRSKTSGVPHAQDAGNKRRKLAPNLVETFASYKSQFTEPLNVWPAPVPSPSPAPSAGPSSFAKRSRPSSGSASPVRKRPRLHHSPLCSPSRRPSASARSANDPPIRIFLKRPVRSSQPGHGLVNSSESESEALPDSIKVKPSNTAKRRASASPDVEEIPGPVRPMFWSGTKRQRTDAHDPPATPRSAARQSERAERRAEREKVRRTARPTSSLFGDPVEELLNVWHGVQSPYADPQPAPAPSFAQYQPFHQAYPGTWEHARTPLFHPEVHATAEWTLPEFSAQPAPQFKAEPDPEQEDVVGSEDGDYESVSEGRDRDSDSEYDQDDEHAANIEASRRKLAELDRDRPLWEEAARKRRQEEQATKRRKQEQEFARRQMEEKARREQERLRANAARAQETREQQERTWRRYQEQQRKRAEQERTERERRERERESKTHSGRPRGSRPFDHEEFEDFAWSYTSWGSTSSPHRALPPKRGATSASQRPWTPSEALQRYNKQCASFDASKYTELSKLSLDAIPWPVLARSPVSVNLVDWDTVGEFFKNLKGLMPTSDYAALVDKSHKRWHPDRWRSRTGAFRFIEGSQEQREEVEKKVNMVSQVLTPLWQETR